MLIGWGLVMIPNRTARDSATNIGLCLPELTPGERRRLVRTSLLETGKTLIETSALWLRPGPQVLRLVKRVDGNEFIAAGQQQGRGIILATPHLGAWEAAGLYCAAAFNITCLYRPLRMPELEELVLNARSRLGGNYVPTNAGGVRALYRTLGAAGSVAMLPDQEPQAGGGVFAPFFGVPAYSMVLLARLAAKTGAPVILVWCERLSWGRGYHLHFRPAPEAVYAADTVVAVGAINRAVEECIRECPSQYQWSYRRFKTRPDGTPPSYQ